MTELTQDGLMAEAVRIQATFVERMVEFKDRSFLWEAKAQEIADEIVPKAWDYRFEFTVGRPPVLKCIAYDPGRR